MSDTVTPFRLDIGDDQLDDLRQRLARARWPEPETVPDWRQGVPIDWLRDLCGYWQDGYDWRRCEAQLNAAGVHDRARRAGHPLHPRAVAVTGRAALGNDTRLARLGHRVPRRHRPARRS